MEQYRKISRRELTHVERSFLSSDNICKIHNTIIARISADTGHLINKQDDNDLSHFMYETMENYSNYNAKDQLQFLNSKLIDACVHRIKNEMIMQSQYIKDASTLPVMIPRGISTTTDKTIEIYKFHNGR